jgi:hypothetical protein
MFHYCATSSNVSCSHPVAEHLTSADQTNVHAYAKISEVTLLPERAQVATFVYVTVLTYTLTRPFLQRAAMEYL